MMKAYTKKTTVRSFLLALSLCAPGLLLKADIQSTAEALQIYYGAILDTANISIFNSTEPIHHRNVNTLPCFKHKKFDTDQTCNFTLSAFFNFTLRKKLTADFTTLNKYINFPEEEQSTKWTELIDSFKQDEIGFSLLMGFLEEYVPEIYTQLIKPIQNDITSPFKLLDDIGQGHIQENRFGFMAHYYHTFHNKFVLNIKCPLLWTEHNANIPSKNKKSLINNTIVKYSMGNSSFDEFAFARQHLILDEFGIGSTQVNIEWLAFDHPERSTWLAGENTKILIGAGIDFPTELSIFKGELGSKNLNIKNRLQILNSFNLINIDGTNDMSASGIPIPVPDNLTFLPNASTLSRQYALQFLDHLSSNLLETSLGNKRHFGLDFSYRSQADLVYQSPWSVQSEIHCKWLLPAYELRLFQPKRIPTPTLEKSWQYLDEIPYVQAFDTFISYKLFPQVFDAKVHPGVIVNATLSLDRSFGKEQNPWDFSLGYNSYWQSEERITKISCSSSQENSLDIKAAQRNRQIYQFKLFAKIHHTFHTKKRDWRFGAYIDGTVYDSNMGNDMTANLSLDYEF